jgi:hypothetical protein
VELLLAEAEERARSVLRLHRDALLAVIAALVDRDELSGPELSDLVAHPHLETR